MNIGGIIKDALILFAITLILGVALSVAKVATQPLVDKSAADAKMKAFNQVCTGYASSEDITDSLKSETPPADITNAWFTEGASGVLKCKDASGNDIGYIAQTSSKGYGGDLNLIIGFDTTGKITGVAYANTPSETPGLGMKTTKKTFLDSWVGHDNADVETVDTISGATISSTAFKQSVRFACFYVNKAVEMNGGN